MATPFQTEAWTEYGIGALVLLLRYFARWKTVGIKNWQGDDYFAILSLIFWTAELVMLELIGQNGTNIGITDEIGATLTDAQIAKLEFGSKCLLAGWNFYVTLIWCLKGTMLCFYDRMTLGLKYQKTVRWTQIACVLAYIGVISVIWGHCTPVHKNWQVTPYPGDQCTLAVANYLTLVVLNLCTDFVIVCIPVPLLWKVKLTLKRKLIIGVLLCSGVFIMIATLLRCILSLKDISGINTSTIWAIRETFVGIIAVNAAAIKPLFSASRWIGSSKGGSSGNYKSSGYGSNKYGHPLGTIGGSGVGPSTASSNRHRKMMTDLGDNSSEEHIVQKADYSKKPAEFGGYQNDIRAGSTNSDRSGNLNGIMVTREYEVSPAKSTLDV
ncbi:hypothetical protein B0J13DRAFT_174877 [Dactylonectria estremocensis]|uniref:Rhodopsin domain-containing protein n=1 Tax=Dactylonectria estremocensis TaxID=1079267 RepID=A0A9P9J9R4_9HYPO|nr:hypothetical protein B0J13DRAFT_174877 [Dactylonectria estremocensis]